MVSRSPLRVFRRGFRPTAGIWRTHPVFAAAIAGRHVPIIFRDFAAAPLDGARWAGAAAAPRPGAGVNAPPVFLTPRRESPRQGWAATVER